ncbi:MAG: HAMP domain-containing histidine kinase, partial [Calothrix sp. SM1_5_4]|nr:HAMP domain-containing histidine kinase [Calothrix sp. SM1_5_4]
MNALLASLSDAFHFLHFPAKDAPSEKAKVLWLVNLRWMAIALFLALSAPAFLLGSLSRLTLPIHLGVLGVLIVFNLITHLVISDTRTPVGPTVICFQLAFDLLILTGLLAVSGGWKNPFTGLFLLNVSLGAVLIQGRLSWPFLVLAHTLLAGLQIHTLARTDDVPTPGTMTQIAASHLLILGFWFVMRSLGAYLERQSENQAQARLTLERQDRLRSIGALAAGFSHEFASPLNAARLRLERLVRNQPSEDAAEACPPCSPAK